jgi:predicted transcriptional regulator
VAEKNEMTEMKENEKQLEEAFAVCVTMTANAEAVLNLLQENPRTVAELSEHIERNVRTVYRAIKELRTEGYRILRSGEWGGGVLYEVEGKKDD